MDHSLVHTNFGGNSYGPIIGPYLFLGKFTWTNGPESFLKFPPTLALVHGWFFPKSSQFCPGLFRNFPVGPLRRLWQRNHWMKNWRLGRIPTQTTKVSRKHPEMFVRTSCVNFVDCCLCGWAFWGGFFPPSMSSFSPLWNANFHKMFVLTSVVPLDPPFPKYGGDGFPLEFGLEWPQTELQTLSQLQTSHLENPNLLKVFPLFLLWVITASGGPEGWFSLAIIAFGASELVVLKYLYRVGKMKLQINRIGNNKR